VRSALTGSDTEVKALKCAVANVQKQLTDGLNLVKQQLSQIADNKGEGVLKRKTAAAAKCSNSVPEASDTAHEHRNQRASLQQDMTAVLARDEVLDTLANIGI
jgi:hypothetical protein